MLRRSLAGILSATSRSGGGVLQLLSTETPASHLPTSLVPSYTTRWASAIPQVVCPEPVQVRLTLFFPHPCDLSNSRLLENSKK